MLLHYSTPSPFASKVRFAAAIAKIKLEMVITDTMALDDDYYAKNPLGKLPMLLTDDQQAIFDSRAITRYLDRLSGGKLYPTDGAKLNEVEVFESVTDGILEASVLIIYEKKFRPEEIQYAPWTDRQWEKIERGVAYLADKTPSIRDGFDIRHACLGACLGYLDLRFAGKWANEDDVLKQWLNEFSRKMPEYNEIKPQ